jgi:hypothetical protein
MLEALWISIAMRIGRSRSVSERVQEAAAVTRNRRSNETVLGRQVI